MYIIASKDFTHEQNNAMDKNKCVYSLYKMDPYVSDPLVCVQLNLPCCQFFSHQIYWLSIRPWWNRFWLLSFDIPMFTRHQRSHEITNIFSNSNWNLQTTFAALLNKESLYILHLLKKTRKLYSKSIYITPFLTYIWSHFTILKCEKHMPCKRL